MIVLLWSIVIVAAIVMYLRNVFSTFSKCGVKNSNIIASIYGTVRVMLRLDHFLFNMERAYNKFSTERFYGRFEITTPGVIIRDIELVKKIVVKDFEHFLDHRIFIDENVDPLFGRNLLALKGQEWKDMRSTLSPAFTSSKMKLMTPFMVEVGEQMIKTLKTKIDISGVNYIDIDAKDLTTRYANDVIATCAFGLNVDSMLEEHNEFYAIGRSTTTFDFKQMLKIFGFLFIPKIMKIFQINLFSDESSQFFKNLVMKTMEDRENRHIIRPDMIHLLTEAKKGKLTHDETTKNVDSEFAAVEESDVGKNKVSRAWNNNDLIAQAVVFFIAGFETVSTAMSFLLHELAVNPDVQERLVQEIKDNEENNGGKLDYKSIQNMVYMDMVVSEVVRLWPPVLSLDRLCVKDYNMGKPNEKAKKDFILRKGTGVSIPLWAFHHDPKLFPDPMKFDPERFSEENKHKIKPFSYMPFGLGPRNCIGSRFALSEVKTMTYQLLKHMELSPCEKTQFPVKLQKNIFNVTIEGGHWIRLKPRK